MMIVFMLCLILSANCFIIPYRVLPSKIKNGNHTEENYNIQRNPFRPPPMPPACQFSFPPPSNDDENENQNNMAKLICDFVKKALPV